MAGLGTTCGTPRGFKSPQTPLPDNGRALRVRSRENRKGGIAGVFGYGLEVVKVEAVPHETGDLVINFAYRIDGLPIEKLAENSPFCRGFQ